MATPATATATATIKFADTLDITLLTPEQIAKFTDKDFAAFSTQQQVDLTAEQVKLLTAKQLALLPTKLLEPETVAAIDPKVIAGLLDPKLVSVFSIKGLSADQFSSLTPEQLKNIPALQFADLTTAQADLLTDTQAVVLTADQISNFSAKAVGALTATTVEALPITAIPGFTAKNIIGLTTDTITALTIEQAAALGSKQVSALTPLLVREMELDDVAALSTAAMRGFTTKNIISLSLSALTSEQFGALASKQVASLTTAQLESLNSEFAPLLTSKAIGAMSSAQIGVLSTDVIATLEPLAVKGFNAKNIKGLTTSQVASITADQAVNLSRVQLKTLASDQVAALNVDSVLAIKPIIFKGLSGALMENLAPTVFTSFSDEQIANLTSAHIASLQSSQVAALSGSQLGGMKPTAIAGLTTTGIQGITTDAVSSLTALQLAKFSTASAGQLESFTPAQAAKLSDEVKTWLATKNYATVQSAETNTTGTKGIYASGTTIAGETVAETITGTSGADVISTGGTTGDKITAGAGNDTITLTSSATGHAHTIAGGDGTDELILDTTGLYASGDFTNVTGIEKVTLQGTGNQNLNLSGTANAFTTVDISALTDAKTLTLSGSYATNKVTVSFDESDLDASGYTGLGLNATSTGAYANIIKTGAGADSILAGDGADTITAGTGTDTMSGEAGNDTFVFAAGANGATPTSTVFDTITDFNTTGSDVIDFGATAISITPALTTAIAGKAQILPTGKAVFHDADDTLAERVAAVANAIGGTTVGTSVLFTDNNNTDAYVFVSDGTVVAGSGLYTTNVPGANDVLIKLSGKGSTAENLGATGGDISTLTSYTKATFDAATASLVAGDIVHVNGASGTFTGTWIAANIDKIDSITFTGSTVALTPAEFATAGVANALTAGSVTVDATTATQAQLTTIIDNASKIAAGGISGTNVTLTPSQFTTDVATALANGVATVATNASTTATTLVANAAKIAAGGITGTLVLTPTEFVTSGVTTALANGVATVAVTSPSTTEVASLVSGVAKIKDGGITITTGMSVTDTQFATLADKITSTLVSVNATDASAAEIVKIVDNIGKIVTGTGITGTGISLTAAQFDAIKGSLHTDARVTINATNATTAELQSISQFIEISAANSNKIAEITNLTLTKEQVGFSNDLNADADTSDTAETLTTTDVIDNLVGKVANGSVNVTATDLTTEQVTALVSNVGKIATSGISATVATSITVDEDQFVTLLSKIGTNVTADVNATSATDAEKKILADNDSKVHSISNLNLTLATNLDTSAGATAATNDAITEKLLNKAVAATVDALNATTDEMTSVFTHIGNIGTLTNSSASVNAAQFVSLYSSLPYGAVIDATGATKDELTFISANIDLGASSKVGSITHLTLNLGEQTRTEINNLLDKSATGTVKTDVTGANNINGTGTDYAATLAYYATKFADGGLTGTGLTLTDTQFAALGTKFATSVTDVTVDANGTYVTANGITATAADAVANATDAELAVISANIGRVGLITDLTITAANQTDTATANLLGKAFALDAQVVADGASSNEVASILSNISKIAANGITTNYDGVTAVSGTTTAALSVTPAQFTAMSTKMAAVVDATVGVPAQNLVTVDATGATAAQLSAMTGAATTAGQNHVNVIKNLTTTATQTDAEVLALLGKVSETGKAVIASSTTLSAANFATHEAKLAPTTTVTVDANAAATGDLTTVSANISNVYAISNLVVATDARSDTETANLLSKAVAGTASVTAATSVSAAEIDAMVTYRANIADLGITAGTLTVTDTQFALLNSKLATGTVLTVNAAGATAGATGTELDSIITNNTKIDKLTNLVLTLDDPLVTGTTAGTLLALATDNDAKVVTATTNDPVEITAVATNITKIAANGITGSMPIIEANDIANDGSTLTALFAKYVGTGATVNLATFSTGQITAVAAAAGKIATGGVTGTGVTMTDTQFATLGAKLADAVVDMTVNADGATANEIIAINTDMDNIASITDVGAAVQTFDASAVATGDTLALVGKAAALALVTVNNFSGATFTGTVVPYSLSLGTNTTTDVTLGVGADTLNVGSLTLAAASSLDGAGGTDVLKVRDGANISAANGGLALTGFENLTFDATNVSGTNDLTMTVAQNNAFNTGTVTAAGTSTNGEKVTLTDVSTSITTAAAVENYVLNGAGANTITLTAAGQNVTTAVTGSTQTVKTGTLTSFTGTITGNGSATDVLDIVTTGTNISSATLTGVNSITLKDTTGGINASMTNAQNALITSAAATEIVTITDISTSITANTAVEAYVLAGLGANTITLTTLGQDVTTSVHPSVQTVDTGALTALTGTTITGNATATDALNITTNATDISAATLTSVERITLPTGISASMTAAQNDLIYSALGSNTVTITAASTAITADVDVEAYVLNDGTGANTITLTTAGQDVTTVASASTQTIKTGALTALTGTTITGGATTDVLEVTTTGTDISAATLTGVEQISLPTGISATMTVTEAGLITSALGTNTVTFTDIATGVTLLTDVETYALGNFVNSVTLAVGTQSVTGNANNDTVTVPAAVTASGTYALAAGTNVVALGAGAILSSTPTVSGGGTFSITLSGTTASMTSAAHAAASGITAAATEALTLTTAATALTLDPDVETYNLATGVNTVTLGTTGGSLTQTVVGDGTSDGVTLGAATYTNIFTTVTSVTTAAGASDISGAGGTTTGTAIGTATLTMNAASGSQVTMTAAQYTAFNTAGIIAAHASADQVLLTDSASITTNAAIESYSLVGGGNTITLANPNAAGVAISATVAGATTIDATSLADGKTLTLSDNSAFTVNAFKGDLTVSDTSTGGTAVTLAAAATVTVAFGTNTGGTHTVNADALTDNQVLTLTGTDAASVTLTAGDLTAGSYVGDLTVTATAGTSTIVTGGGADTVEGGAGDDSITVGAGSNVISFGSTLASGTAGDALAGGGVNASVGSDTITAFVTANDSFLLDETVFGVMGNGVSIGAQAPIAANQFHTQAGTGVITNASFDVVGNGAIIFDSAAGAIYFVEAGATYSTGVTSVADLVTAQTAVLIGTVGSVTGTVAAADFLAIA